MKIKIQIRGTANGVIKILDNIEEKDLEKITEELVKISKGGKNDKG